MKGGRFKYTLLFKSPKFLKLCILLYLVKNEAITVVLNVINYHLRIVYELSYIILM